MRVLGDRVLVALPPAEDEKVTASGIVLVKDPDRFQTPTRGLVVALGEKTGTLDREEVLSILADAGVGAGPFVDLLGLANTIAALGPAPFDVALNDCVIFPAGAGEQYEDGGIQYVILRESEIIGIVEEKDAAA